MGEEWQVKPILAMPGCLRRLLIPSLPYKRFNYKQNTAVRQFWKSYWQWFTEQRMRKQGKHNQWPLLGLHTEGSPSGAWNPTFSESLYLWILVFEAGYSSPFLQGCHLQYRLAHLLIHGHQKQILFIIFITLDTTWNFTVLLDCSQNDYLRLDLKIYTLCERSTSENGNNWQKISQMSIILG